MAEHNSQTKLNNSPHMGRHEFGDFHVEDPTLKMRLNNFQSYNHSNHVGIVNSPQVLGRDEWLASPSGDEVETGTFDNVLHIDDEDDVELSNDAASETGTYTIDRDNSPCDDQQPAHQEADDVVVESLQLADDALGGDISDLSSYRNGSDWINDWASQVAQHTRHPEPLVVGLPPLPSDKQAGNGSRKASPSTSTHIPSPVHSPSGTLPRSGHRGPLSPSPSPRHGPLVPSEINDETQSFLRTTESVVCAMQARMSLSLDSGGESDVDTSHSYQLAKRGGSIGDRHQLVRRTSSASNGSSYRASRAAQSEDSSSEASEVKFKKPEPPPPQMKYNRAFSLRRARLDCEPPAPPPVSETKTKVETGRTTASKAKKNVQPIMKPTIPLQTSASASNVTKPKTLSRTDCGRFSVRASKPVPQPTPAAKQPPNAVKKGSKKAGGRSNSTLSSREVEFQNWKRRKSYDPMKAAAEGKKKDAAKKATFNTCMTQSTTTVEEMSESHQNPVLRSASFHGTVGMVPTYVSSEDEDSPPTSEYPSMLAPVAGSPVKLSGDGAIGGSRVSLHSTASNSSFRGRTKLEALDSLVMTALLGLSSKLRNSSCVVLKKLRYLYEEDADKTEQLSAIIEILESSTQPSSPQGKSPSKELSGTLKNMKQIEYVFKVLDEILFDDEEFEDLDGDTTLQ